MSLTNDKTRKRCLNDVAATWHGAHTGAGITMNDLAKVVQQMITEVFATGRERSRDLLSEYALSVALHAEVEVAMLAPARTYSAGEELPAAHSMLFTRLGQVLVPLAAAVLLVRVQVTEEAAVLARERGVLRTAVTPASLVRREDLRPLVVSRVKPRAYAVHGRLGFDLTAGDYARELLRERLDIAGSVVSAAVAAREPKAPVDSAVMARLDAYLHEDWHALAQAAQRFGAEADDALGDGLLKLASAIRSRPDLDLRTAYGVRAVINAALSRLSSRRARGETVSSDLVEIVSPAREDADVAMLRGTILERVLRSIEGLGDPCNGITQGSAVDRLLAKEALRWYFLADREAVRPVLADHVLTLSDPSGAEVRDALRSYVAATAGSAASARRAVTLAMAALRSGTIA